MSTSTVFYCWERELPNNTNRGLIQRALEDAVRAIRDDGSISVEPRVDADTQGVPGSPDIGATIFEKIRNASAFVADVSLVTRAVDEAGAGVRQTPNPNVLIELGYAAGVLGWDRIVMVLNAHFGPVEDLPFDLRKKRTLVYRAAPDDDQKAPERKGLSAQLDGALRLIFEATQTATPRPPSSFTSAREAVEGQTRPRDARVRAYAQNLVAQIDALRPESMASGEAQEDALLTAIEASTSLVAEFATLARTIAEHDDAVAAGALLRGLEELASRYHSTGRLRGSSYDTDFDLYRFVGHELLVVLVASLLHEERWATLSTLLQSKLSVDNNGRLQQRTFACLAYPVTSLSRRKQRLQSTAMSLHADLLKLRYTQPPLSGLCSFDDFMEAEYLLFLKATLPPPSNPTDDLDAQIWRPFSLVYYANQVPRFLARSTEPTEAKRLASFLGFTAIDAFRKRMAERGREIEQMIPDPFKTWRAGNFDPNSIGRGT